MYRVTPSHSWCITHCSPVLHPAHLILTTQCHSEGGVFSGRQQSGNIWHILSWLHMCLCVCRSPLSDELRAPCLSWDGGRVTVVTDMPKPDLLCLVQLLDGLIETFRVSVRSTHTHTHSFLSVAEEIICCSYSSLFSANDHGVSAWYSGRLFFPISIDLHLSFTTVTLVWSTHPPPAAYRASHTFTSWARLVTYSLTRKHRKTITILLLSTAAVQHLYVIGGRVGESLMILMHKEMTHYSLAFIALFIYLDVLC